MNSRAQKLVAMACEKHSSNEKSDSEEEPLRDILETHESEVTMLHRLKNDPLLKLQNTAFICDPNPKDTITETTEDLIHSPSLIQLDDLDVVQKSLHSTFFNYDLEGNEIIEEIEVVSCNNIHGNQNNENDMLNTILHETETQDIFNNDYNTLITNGNNNSSTDMITQSTSTEENLENQSNVINNTEEQISNTETSVAKTQLEENVIGRPKRGRKRKIADQSRKERKRRANVNVKYINAKGKEVLPKTFDQTFSCGCKKKCTEIISVDDRKRIFDQFWSIGSYEGRCAYICANVKETNKSRCYSTEDSKRMVSRKYFFDDNEICKKAFLQTLRICQSRIDVAMKKKNSASDLKDNRGIASGGNNRTSEENIKKIVDHINSFPKYISHYCRGKTNSRYLNTDLNLFKMYDLFKLKHSTEENLPTLATYKKIFYEKFNLKFKAPKSDTCKTCDAFAAKLKLLTSVDAEELKEKRDVHLSKASVLRDKMNEDLKIALEIESVETLTFDMQKTHPLPKIPSNIAYYKRQLNLYNLGIYIGSNKKSIFNLWLEHEGGKGTQEVGSCLRKYILNNIQHPITELILWSDSCGGQNRSIKLVLMLIHTMQHHSSLKSITMRFLLSGHCFLPNDANFGVIETRLKTQQRLYTLEDYAESITMSKKQKKFEVTRMLSPDMLSVELLEKAITNRKVDSAKNKVNWLNVHEIVMEKDSPHILKIKNDLDEEPQVVNIEKAGKGRKPVLKNIDLPGRWPNGKSLSKEKIKDLRELLKLVPADARSFYDFLKGAQGVTMEEDVDGYHAEDFDNVSENDEN
ncbi:uncharacterized protein LOC114357160 [Ostrinia furnacalis]|uniref:uncharacterized protein LOC114357160 n=1 Tax=Ostrinia furnacalis TaxID=93504 RepID=UPI00103A3D00|nr:uncharacterized protein LOC114357160 [Ostrinia furnacalis]